MTSDFLPEYFARQTPLGWRASFRRFVDEREIPVPGGRLHETEEAAIASAKDYLREQFNRPLTGIVCEPPAVIDEMDAARRRKEMEAQDEIERVFGKRRIVRDCAGNQVEVETKRKRA